ncbi:N-acetylmuramic acid 6-phosphate etherase [Actinacidiphila rubida]|uniref:N-acetylmuramic acid 6-phosphate etherase n=1 Tax=Actinacidiphila rubida TaxID=310780 RepID=A0A1H8KPV6_9ACTN|nr:N-acetylmuramic acid 6-phosphate etherase [Actinacidiphila rubida]SEN94929.1 N-acetylmuramic acid 6-phosphate etherase [Actinacidiphila rubida]
MELNTDRSADLSTLGTLGTETRNEHTADLDGMPVADLLTAMNDEDQTVALAVRRALPRIAEAVEAIEAALRQGGRLIYLGAGTSGRIGLLDAVECPPTFGTDPQQVMGLLAGGPGAFITAVEGAEDDPERAVADVAAAGLSSADVLVGLAASGRTPYVVGGLRYAREIGATTVSIACNAGAEISRHAGIAIEVVTGPEVLTGSTRLKAGTAEKLVCNMLSTATMVRLGKVYGNLMVDVRATNAKLVDRARRIVVQATGASDADAERALSAADGHAKTAIVMLLAGLTREEAAEALLRGDGGIRSALGSGTAH